MIITSSCLKLFIACLLAPQLVSAEVECEDMYASVVKIYSGNDYLCAGALLKDNFVMTSSQCIMGYPDDEIRVVGNVPVPADIDMANNLISTRSDIMDIAVLKLDKSIAGPIIKPAELCDLKKIKPEEDFAFYTWNLTTERNSISIPSSDAYTLYYIDDPECKNTFLESTGRKEFSKSTICLGNSESYCFADRGGPISHRGKLCGIYHWAPLCINSDMPGIFTSFVNRIEAVKSLLSKAAKRTK